MAELLPGKSGRDIVNRSRLWSYIKEYQGTQKNATDNPTPFNSASSEISISTDEKSISTEGDTSADSIHMKTSTPDTTKEKIVKRPTIRQPAFSAPNYFVYGDPDLDLASDKLATMPKELVDRLIRGVIDGMCAESAEEPFKRWPHHSEVREMARSVALKYPSVKDADGSLKSITKKLIRRMENKKYQSSLQNKSKRNKRKPSEPTEKVKETSSSIDRCKSKKKVVEEEDDEFEAVCFNDHSVASKESPNDTNSDSDFCDHEYSPAIQVRHYNEIEKLQKKKLIDKDKDVLNLYLNKEFTSRRNWIRNLPSDQRIDEILTTYSCFKDLNEIIEEVRRIIGQPAVSRKDFLNSCVKRLDEELDPLIYYGVEKGTIQHPSKPSKGHKVLHLLKHISDIFPKCKKPKKVPDLVVTLEAHQNPSHWASKRIGNSPVLVTAENEAYVVVGSRILLHASKDTLGELMIAYLGTYYLLDFDYPTYHEFGLSILQFLLFQHRAIPKDLVQPLEDALDCYQRFKAD